MIFSDKDKKIVDQYKQANILLRKQLDNLNTQIDKLLDKHSNKVGLQKLPEVQKKITDPKVIQNQVQNLRKRLQLLQKDSQALQAKTQNNYHAMIKQCQARIQQQENQMHQYQRSIKQYERKDKIADVIASKQQKNKKWQKKISIIQQELARAQKLQKQLMKQINIQQVTQAKSTQHLHSVSNKHHETIIKVQQQLRHSRPAMKQNKSSLNDSKHGISQQQWKQLKIEFLTFKQSKQNQEAALNMQNQNLRKQIKQWTRKIKQKKNRIESIKINEQKQRIRAKKYATLQESNVKKKSQNYRYRDRNNSVRYNNTQNL